MKYLDWLPATVPGHVHLDLIQQGIIPDPFKRRYEFGTQWVDQVGWSYRTTFTWNPKEGSPSRVLSFEGLDTIATVKLNGKKIASSDNMHLAFEVDVTEALRDGENELLVEFESAVEVGMKRRDAYFAKEGLDRATDNFDERAFVRKAGYMYAWDWGPRFVSCGIWRPIRLLEFASRITAVRWETEALKDGSFRVTPTAEVEGQGAVTFTLDGVTRRAGEKFSIKPELWWPNGYGAQPLYEAVARLDNGDTVTKKLGFRTIELKREKDAQGESFQFVVNGLPIHCRGANWIPNDSFPSRVTEADYESQVAQCRALNMTMLRVWGGGLYESEAFYDACDRHGILVWQDFPFACSYYPDDRAMQTAVKLEASQHVKRLRDRPSLALWCGNNENLTMWEGKWGRVHPKRFYGENLYDGTLPKAVAEHDPKTAYIASSPIGGSDANADDFGDQHYWNVWHGMGDWTHYASSRARFCSEFGFASACLPALWDSTLVDHTLGGEEHLSHDKTNKPWALFQSYVDLHYPNSKTLAEWTYRSQLNQRDAMRFGIEHYRRDPGCKGALVWQFNDCWPVQSWALQDYDRKLKVAGWEMARLCAPILLSVVTSDDSAEIWLINDGPTEVEEEVVVTLVATLDGAIRSKDICHITAEPGARILVTRVGLGGVDRNATALKVMTMSDPRTARWCLLSEPKDAQLPAAAIDLVSPGAFRVKGFVRDLIASQGDQWLVSNGAGRLAVTACNEVVTYDLISNEPVRLMSIAGEHPVHIG